MFTVQPSTKEFTIRLPAVGTPAPWFTARSTSNEKYRFDTVAGRYIVLCFFATAGDETGRATLAAVARHRRIFDDIHASFFGVSIDPEDEKSGRVAESMPGIRHFWDFDQAISRQFGNGDPQQYHRFSVILDERLCVYAMIAIMNDAQAHVAKLVEVLGAAPAVGTALGIQVPAPVLIVPRVFSADLCRRLMEHYNAGGATDSGFMREIDGKTVGIYDYGHKRRTDKTIEDEALKKECMGRIHACVIPEIRKAFQFHANRIERHIVACYDGETGGHFRPHRDNTTKGTAHRRFAVSLVLNSGEFAGGLLRFPEFGQATYNPPAGGAVVFSCSLLHEATAVTKGQRYVYLPFLYDDAAAAIREENQGLLSSGDLNQESAE